MTGELPIDAVVYFDTLKLYKIPTDISFNNRQIAYDNRK